MTRPAAASAVAVPRRGRGPRGLRGWATAALALVALVAPLGAAGATASGTDAAQGEGQVRWAVQPATQEGPDDRRVISHDVEPGSEVTDHVAVRNLGDGEVTFALTANDGYLTASGGFDMRPSDHVPTDGGSWIALAPEVTLGPDETAVVPFTITVPADATPGDHPAGVAASIRSSGDGMVGTEHRVGVRVNIRVAGDVLAAAELSDVTSSLETSWNPLQPGSLEATAVVANTGNVRISGELRVETSTWFGSSVVVLPATTPDAPGVGEVVPGGERTVAAEVGGVWGVGPVTTTVTFTPEVLGSTGGAGADATAASVTATTTTWGLPWPQLALVLLLVGLMLTVRSERRRRRRGLERMLRDAHEAGVREGAGSGAGTPSP